MKRVVSGIICVLSLFILACDRHSSLTPPVQKSVSDVTIGDVHTEFLEKLFSKYAKVKPGASGAIRSSQAARSLFLDMCHEAANETAEEYGSEPLTAEEVRTYIEMGEKLALTVTEFDMRQVLQNRRAQEWWDRYSMAATAETAREVYELHCATYGAPRPLSELDCLMSTVVSSAEFWVAHRGDEEPLLSPQTNAAKSMKDDLNLSSAGWKKRLLRFCVTVAVDGVSASLAGAGAGAVTGGVGSAVVGGIVGGLASAGADNILFGGD